MLTLWAVEAVKRNAGPVIVVLLEPACKCGWPFGIEEGALTIRALDEHDSSLLELPEIDASLTNRSHLLKTIQEHQWQRTSPVFGTNGFATVLNAGQICAPTCLMDRIAGRFIPGS